MFWVVMAVRTKVFPSQESPISAGSGTKEALASKLKRQNYKAYCYQLHLLCTIIIKNNGMGQIWLRVFFSVFCKIGVLLLMPCRFRKYMRSKDFL